MIRLFDIFLSLFGILFFFPVFLLLIIIGLFDTGSPLFFQKRVGSHQKTFELVKLRTMKLGTASVATHLVDARTVTTIGCFLRKTKLDELPQLWNVIKGDMSLVGPRPCLTCQLELIQARQNLGVYDFKPGVTGLAQIKGIDMSTPKELAKIDAEMVHTLTLTKYFFYIINTALGKGSGDKVQI